VDKRFDILIDRVLQNDPSKRYQTAAELEVDLRKLLVKPTRVAGWIFAVVALGMIGYLSYFYSPDSIESSSGDHYRAKTLEPSVGLEILIVDDIERRSERLAIAGATLRCGAAKS